MHMHTCSDNKKMQMQTAPAVALTLVLVCYFSCVHGTSHKSFHHSFTSFTDQSRDLLSFSTDDSNIYKEALQITMDTSNPFYHLQNSTGRVLFKKKFRLWRRSKSSAEDRRVVSFTSDFVMNIVPMNNTGGGEGVAFIICNTSAAMPNTSYGPFLGLFNNNTDGDPYNGVVGVEFDTVKSGAYDPDDNHVGVDLHSIKSVYTKSLNASNITLADNSSNKYVSVRYDSENLTVYINNGKVHMQTAPVISMKIDLARNLSEYVYFGFTGSTGMTYQLNCIHQWNLTVQNLDYKGNKSLIIGASLGAACFVFLLIGAGLVYWVVKRRRNQQNRTSIRALDRVLTDYSAGPRKFKLRELVKATDNFDKKYMLGQGGFGAVYMGVLINKTPVAVKRVSENSNQGEQEFIAEVTIISRLRHKNLVRLLGWCYEDSELLLVYDYMPNGSLDRLIFDTSDSSSILDWDRRYKIINGIASALLYLHQDCEQQVIHRDLKASNVMLDAEYNARLGDFGLAKLIENNKQSYTTTAVAGTPGYIAPECFHTGKATVESDVFSFGTVVLEIACGRRPRTPSMVYLVDWVWALYGDYRILDAADPKLEEFDKDEMRNILLLGLACSHPIPKERPNMRMVQQILCKDIPPLALPLAKPAFVWHSPAINMFNLISSSTSNLSSQQMSSTTSS